MRKILLAFDGSQAAGFALRRLASFAAEDDSVVVLSVVPSIDLAFTRNQQDRAKLFERASSCAARARTQLFELGVASTTVVEDGDPGVVICACAATTQCDLVVVGTRGMHGVYRLAHRSTSTFVARRAHCDVLIVRPTRGSHSA